MTSRTFGKAFESSEPVGGWLADEDSNVEGVGKDFFYVVWFAGYGPDEKTIYEELERAIQTYNEQETGNIYVLADGGKTNGEGGTFRKKLENYRKGCSDTELDSMILEINTEIIMRNTLAIMTDSK